MRSTVARPTLDERERLSVLVTELLGFATRPDPATQLAARQILSELIINPVLSEDDQRLARIVLSAPAPPAPEPQVI